MADFCRGLCGCARSVIMGGRSKVNTDAWTGAELESRERQRGQEPAYVTEYLCFLV